MKKKNSYTADISPRLGWSGLLGLLGFLGFISYDKSNMFFPFCFFCLFGLFGLFYDGKMRHTLKDEKYKENERNAKLQALQIGFGVSCTLVIISTLGIWNIWSRDFLLIFLLIGMSLNVSIVVFLSKYYLYKFDCSNKNNG